MDLRLKTLIVLLLFPYSTWGFETLYAPAYCEPEFHTLEIENRSPLPQRFWSQIRTETDFEEQGFDIPARGTLKISAAEISPELTAFTIRPFQENTLRVTSHCHDKISTLLSRTTSPEVIHYVLPGTSRVHLHLLNLFLDENVVNLRALSAQGTLLEETTLHILKHYDTQFLDWHLPAHTSRIEVRGENRLSSTLFFETREGDWKSSPAFAAKPVVLQPASSKVYFLVAAKNTNLAESFVVGMDDAQMIATAREQILNPQMEKIMIAGIEKGHGQYNRSFSTQDRAPYSWSVNRVDAFGDFAHISCDGSPDLTEERLERVLTSGGGRICFWRYRILRELTLKEVAEGVLQP